MRSMLLAFMRFEAIPSVRKLCRRLRKRQFAREICEFGASDHTTFSKFITRAGPETVEKLFLDFLFQAFKMGMIDPSVAIVVCTDSQYYSEEVFKAFRRYGAEPVIPHSSKVKEPLINLYVARRFRVKGEKRLVELYKRRMAVERTFKASKLELSMEKPKWRGIAKIRMHVAICFSCILAVAIVAHKIERPELANNIAAFTY